MNGARLTPVAHAWVPILAFASLTACASSDSVRPDAGGERALDAGFDADFDAGFDAGFAPPPSEATVQWIHAPIWPDWSSMSYAIATGAEADVVVASGGVDKVDAVSGVRVSTFHAWAGLRWETGIELVYPPGTQAFRMGSPTGVVLAAAPTGDVYVAFASRLPVRVGTEERACATTDPDVACLVFAAFAPDGTLRWLTTIDATSVEWLAAVDDGLLAFVSVSVGDANLGMETVTAHVVRFSTTGDATWAPLPRDLDGPNGYAVEPPGSFWVATSSSDDCGLLVLFTTETQEALRKKTCTMSFLGDVVRGPAGVVTLGTELVAGVGQHAAYGFDLVGNLQWKTPLPTRFGFPWVRRDYLTSHGAETLVTAPDCRPVLALDGEGHPSWQWPGSLSDDDFTERFEGPCNARVAPAPDGGAYVLSDDLPQVRELLGLPPAAPTSPTDPMPHAILVRIARP